MAFALLIIGAVLLTSAVKGTTDGTTGLWGLLQSDFTGQNNFIYWVAAILIIGAVGYIPKARPVSIAMLTLVLVVLFLSKGSGFSQALTAGLATTTTATASGQSAATQSTGSGLLGALKFLDPATTLIQ